MRATGRAMTAAEIAARMEVAPRTIYRDMEHLIASGAPIEGERGVGYLLREAFDAPPLTFTFEQLEALAFGLRAVEMLGDPRLGQAAREAKDKMRALLPPEHAARLASAPIHAFRAASQPEPPECLGDVRTALSVRRKVWISYNSLAGEQSQRTVWPLGLSAFGAIWVATTWCETRNDFRDFRLDRIEDWKVLSERFEPDQHQTYAAYLAGLQASWSSSATR
ncbi:DNA-binding transcriptional regulator [Ciceribacter naphthalenivorans]|uniref:DNA-binding transcriptional regulator n=4 Tax=Pseudomonadota TaxID=1224 RepID=A0A512HF63_9HYPH|nr:DNA-binding transcriptional regulator [Ciceribacter naphthalenivorans]GLR21055.1 DNA-binding transcriptional regulator [Ciceribacter naphthalenivorans]GLT03911.1 DNA-binding transcriptional regulator [Sphingomonas psychrolutea]